MENFNHIHAEHYLRYDTLPERQNTERVVSEELVRLQQTTRRRDIHNFTISTSGGIVSIAQKLNEPVFTESPELTIESLESLKSLPSWNEDYNHTGLIYINSFDVIYGIFETGNLSLKSSRNSKLDSSRSIIRGLANNQEINEASNIASRLSNLFDYSLVEMDEMQDVLRLESLQNFIDFLKLNPKINRPDIIITPEGHIRARWKKDNRHFFRLEFRTNLNVNFVCFSPNVSYPKKDDKSSGVSTADQVFSHLKPYNVESWVFPQTIQNHG